MLLIDLRGHGATRRSRGRTRWPRRRATWRDGGARVRPRRADAVGTDAYARGRDGAPGPGPQLPGREGRPGLQRRRVGHIYKPPARTWLFDSNPTITTGAGGVGEVLAILEDAARDRVYATTKAAVAALQVERGLEPATAQWLAMTTEKADDGGVRFSYDLDAVRALYDDHCQIDLLPKLGRSTTRIAWAWSSPARLTWSSRPRPEAYLFARGERPQRPRGRAPGLLDVVVGTHGADWVPPRRPAL